MSIKVDRFFDIETSEWDRFVMGGVMDAADRHYQHFDKARELFENLVTVGGEVWSWNGGLFDMVWVAEWCRRLGYRFTANAAGSRVTRLEVEGLVLRDAMALVPMSLAKGAGIVGRALSKDTGLACVCGERCGGYCAIVPDLPPRKRAKLARYLRLDVETGLDVLLAVVGEAERSGYELTGTVGGSSYRTAAKLCKLDDAEWDTVREYLFCRGAYYGGRTEVFRPEADSGWAWDINSAYPAALVRVALPCGDRMRISGPRAARAFDRGLEGVYLACVDVPSNLHVPPLPHRLKSGRVVFPIGPLEGVWTGIELRHARGLGCVVRIRSGLVWSDSDTELAPFMRHGWAQRERAKAAGNDSLAGWHKWILNSCTGKLAESPDKERILGNPEPEDVIACDCTPHCNDRCGAWRMMDLDGHLWGAPFFRISECSHVHWAAYLTAATRIELGEMLRADGDGGRSAVYCDTDSVYAIEDRTRNIGPELGQFKLEGAWSEWRAPAPKVYTFMRDGRRVNKAKGLQGLDDASWDDFAAGITVERDRGVMGLKSAARAGGKWFRRKRIERTNLSEGLMFGGRMLGPDGVTYPMTVRELEAMGR